MSASITSERSNLRKRGTMLAYIFSNQGWGSFVGSLVTIIVLAAYRPVMEGRGETSKVDGGKSTVADQLRLMPVCERFPSLSVADNYRSLSGARFCDTLSAFDTARIYTFPGFPEASG